VIWLWIVLSLVVLAALILALPIGLLVRYDADGARAWAKVGFVRVSLYPAKEKSEKSKEKATRKKREKARKKEQKKAEKPKTKGGGFRKFRAGLSLVRPIFRQVKGRLTIRTLTLHYTAGSSDAAKAAIRYGAASAAVGTLMPWFNRHFRIKKQDVQVNVDFTGSEEDVIFFHAHLSITFWGALRIGIFAAIRAYRAGLFEETPEKGGKKA